MIGRDGLPPRERERQAAAVLDQAQRRKARLLLADGSEQIRRDQMAMDVDDHSSSFFSSRFRVLAIVPAIRPRTDDSSASSAERGRVPPTSFGGYWVVRLRGR